MLKKHMNRIILLLTIIGMITILSCGDCLQKISGTVLDEQTKQPIDSVYIQEENKYDYNCFTDPKGNFKLSRISGGLFRCPTMKVVISKTGYETFSLKIENGEHKTIKLRKLSKI
jgi:hypothetical protein